MKTTTWLSALALTAAVLAVPGEAQEAGRRLHASLDGRAEVPEPGNLSAFGTAILSVNLDQQRVCFDIQVAELEPPSGAHIHRGAAGENGDVVVNLTGASGGELAGCADAAPELLNELLASPDGFYVNVHTEAHPSGAIRGQLSRRG